MQLDITFQHQILMTNKSVFILGTILSLMTIGILANRIENGDTNAISMYFIVFLIPALILSVINTFYLKLLNKLLNKLVKIILGLIPIIILALLSFKNNLTLPIIDGDLSFNTQVASIALGLTNVIWGISLFFFQSTKTLQ